MKTRKGKYVEGTIDEINNLFAGKTMGMKDIKSTEAKTMKCEYCKRSPGAQSRYLGVVCADCYDEIASRKAHYDRMMDQDLTGQDQEVA